MGIGIGIDDGIGNGDIGNWVCTSLLSRLQAKGLQVVNVMLVILVLYTGICIGIGIGDIGYW